MPCLKQYSNVVASMMNMTRSKPGKNIRQRLCRGEKLNAYQFKKLCFNQLGTDIEVELVRPHRWGGGLEVTPEGVAFVPNLPTEEIFCIPREDGVKTVGEIVTG